jgi:hypothetical protein
VCPSVSLTQSQAHQGFPIVLAVAHLSVCPSVCPCVTCVRPCVRPSVTSPCPRPPDGDDAASYDGSSGSDRRGVQGFGVLGRRRAL